MKLTDAFLHWEKQVLVLKPQCLKTDGMMGKGLQMWINNMILHSYSSWNTEKYAWVFKKL